METPHTTTNAYDHLIKILLVGDTGSNKSTLLRAYLDDSGVGQSGTTTLGQGMEGEGSLLLDH